MHTNDSRSECFEKFVGISYWNLWSIVPLDMILCGSPYSGKSSAAMLMIDVLTQMQQQQQLLSAYQQQKSSSISQEANYTQEAAGQTHKLYR